MKSSQILIDKIKEFEGCRLTAYQDSVGVWTIGYGHTLNAYKGMKITDDQAKILLIQDLASKEKFINSLNKELTQGQFDALVDFCFNLGTENLRTSTLLIKILKGASNIEIKKQFLRWVYAGNKVLPGLVKRRNWEANRFTEK